MVYTNAEWVLRCVTFHCALGVHIIDCTLLGLQSVDALGQLGDEPQDRVVPYDAQRIRLQNINHGFFKMIDGCKV